MGRPNLFIVGAPKCGTTSLHNYLAEHPECFMSRIKEPGYFSRAFVRADVRKTVPYLNSKYAYTELFSGADARHTMVGESSTSYLRDAAALAELKEFSGDPRIIALVRDPVALVSSYFHFHRFQGIEPLATLREAWDAQDERCHGNIASPSVARPDSLAYRYVAMLGEQVDRLYRMFDRNRVLILLSDHLNNDPENVGRKIQEFLGMTYMPGIKIPRHNVAKVAKLQFLDDIVKRSPSKLIRLKDQFKRLIGVHRLGIRATLDRFNSVPEPHSVAPELELEMRDYFREDVALLARLLKVDLFDMWDWQ